jgi:hypothetical protein
MKLVIKKIIIFIYWNEDYIPIPAGTVLVILLPMISTNGM